MGLFSLESVRSLFHWRQSQKTRHRETDKYKPEIHREDVFLISFPRSGNTWLRYMLTLLHPGVVSKEDRDIHRVIPNLDQRPDLGRTPEPRVIKSHGTFHKRYPRVIYLLRDGRDATYSYYVFCQKEFAYPGSFYEFLSVHPYPPSRWHEHVESWLGRNHRTPLLLIRYEEMLVDPELQLKRALQFLSWKPSDDEIKSAIAETSLEKMIYRQNTGYFLAHVRSGKAGDWRNQYSREELELFMSFSADTLRRFGYDLS
jgi:estrone sulfotransferase